MSEVISLGYTRIKWTEILMQQLVEVEDYQIGNNVLKTTIIVIDWGRNGKLDYLDYHKSLLMSLSAYKAHPPENAKIISGYKSG